MHHIQSVIGIAVPGSCGLLLDLEAFRRRYGDASWHSAGSLSSVLQAWGRRHSIDTTLAKDVCLWSLWQPLAVLALNCEWHTLAVVIGKQTRKSLIPPALYSQLDSPSAPAPDVAGDDGSLRQDLFSRDRFDVLADAVRKWAPIIMRSDAGLDVECSEAFLTGIAEWADNSARASDDLGDNRSGAGLRSKFKAEFAINSLLIASMLRKDALLADVATSVLEALLPPCFFAWLQSSGAQIKDFDQHMATVSRMRLPFLAAWALCWQHLWADIGNACVFLQIDSSPQFGRDWVITVMTYVKDNELNDLQAWLTELHELAQTEEHCNEGDGDRGGPVESFQLQRRVELTKKVNGTVHHHILHAGAVASGRGSLLHKLHCFLHELFLSIGDWEVVFRLCRTVCAFTTDLGTEFGLRKVKCQR